MIYEDKKKVALSYNYCNKKNENLPQKKRIFDLLKPNHLQYLSIDEILIIHYRNGISNSF
jgi:hypothetical protein